MPETTQTLRAAAPSFRIDENAALLEQKPARAGCYVAGCTAYRGRGCALCLEHTEEASRAALFVREHRERVVRESPALSALLEAKRLGLFNWSTDSD